MSVPATLSQLVTPVTQPQYLQQLLQGHEQNRVPWRSWLSSKNVGLSLTQLLARKLATLNSILVQTAAGVFLDYSSGVALTLLAKSGFQLDRTPAQFTQGMLLLTAVPAAPAYSFSAGQITAGTPGALSTTRLYTNTASGSLRPGQFEIDGAQGLTLTQKGSGVTIEIVVAGTNTLLSVPPAAGKSITINQATDAQGNPVGTSTQIATALAAQASVAALLTITVNGAGSTVPGAAGPVGLDGGGLVLPFIATAPGAGANLPYGAPLVLKTSFAGVSISTPLWIGGTWITSQGAEEESDDRLKLRCVARWGTLGVGGNEDAFRFWALQIPDGYSASPVSQVSVLSNNLGGAPAGGAATVCIVGPDGALTVGDVAAVQRNFDQPITSLKGDIPGLELLGKKYPIGCQVQVVTATNHTITLSGTVSVFRSAHVSLDDVAAAVAAALSVYQQSLLMGETIYPMGKVAGVIGQATPFQDAIAKVDLSGMSAAITSTITQYPKLQIALSYVLVDG